MRALLAVAFMSLAACGGDSTEQTVLAMNGSNTTIADVTDSEWNALASRRIFFGHQSVGRNIMDGMRRVVADNPQIGLALVNATDPATVDGPAFIDADIGHNGEPDSKDAAFAAIVGNGLGDQAGAIAMYKYCYVDVHPETNPEDLFAAYVAQVEEVRSRFPDVTIVHFTLPLRTPRTGLKEQVKTLIGRRTQLGLNMKRNAYNELLRERFGATDPVFDLAALESTRPDGSRATSRYFLRRVSMLAPEYTDDGGHLNEAAQYRVAERLLVFLAKLGAAQGQSPVAVDAGGAR